MMNSYKNTRNDDDFGFDSIEDTSKVVLEKNSPNYSLIYKCVNLPLNQSTFNEYQFVSNLDVENNTSLNIMRIKGQKIKALKSLFEKWKDYIILIDNETEDLQLLDDYWVESIPIDYKKGLKFLDRYKELNRD